ncbi:MAG: hypothetical protein ACETWM_13635 [Candidatus Lokiarchaeia archaeon]
MQATIYLILGLGVLLSAIGIAFLIRPNPKYMPKISYRIAMKGISEESSITFMKIYGAAALIAGICLIVYFIVAYLGASPLPWF